MLLGDEGVRVVRELLGVGVSRQFDGSQELLSRSIEDTITQRFVRSRVVKCHDVHRQCVSFGHDINHLVASPFFQ